MFRGRENLTKEEVLNRVPEEEIFRYYLGFFSWSKQYRNPLRSDRKPGCNFREKNSRVYFYDYSLGKRYDCFDIVMEMKRVDFYTALEDIAGVFFQRDYIRQPPRPQIPDLVQVDVEPKTWNGEFKFWQQYYLSELIVKYIYRTIPLRQLKENGQIRYVYHNKSVAFYWEVMPRQYKLYFPYFKIKSRHYNASLILGYDQLVDADHLVITKSMKDVMVLRELGINAVSPTSETFVFNEEVMKELLGRYPKVFTLLDNDKTGKIFTLKWRRLYNTTPLLLHQQKDISDFIEQFGYRNTNQLIETACNYYEIKRIGRALC